MKTAVIIAFSYNYGNSYGYYDDKHENVDERVQLPGIIIDLFLMYEFVKANKYKRIVVFTDIFSDVNLHEVINPVTQGYVNSEIFTLIKDLQERKEVIFYHNLQDFNYNLKSILSNSSHLFLYYTGHAKKDYLVMPLVSNYCTVHDDMSENETLGRLNTNDFINFMLKNTPSDCQMLLLFDCCNGSNFRLPFYLDKEGVYHNTITKEPIYTGRNIICFVSSSYDESSHCTYEGSPFTRLVIKELKNKITKRWGDILFNVQKDLNKIVGKQTVCLYSSLPTLNYIWSWLNYNSNLHLHWEEHLKVLDIKIVT